MEISDQARRSEFNAILCNVIIDVDERKILSNWNLQPDANL